MNQSMKKSSIFAVVVLLAGATFGAANDAIGMVGDIKLKGYLGGRLDKMIVGHVAGRDIDYITSCFLEKTETKGWWQTEFWGKYMHAAVPYARYADNKKLTDNIARGISTVLQSQEPCGYIGNYPDELRFGEGWDVWGMKYTMMGLIHFHDAAPDSADGKRALAACRKLCDYIIAEIGPNGRRGRALWQTGNWSGFASSSILEPVVWLYRRTKEPRYLAFATDIAKGMTGTQKDGPRLLDLALKGVSVADRSEPATAEQLAIWSYISKTSRCKAYEMMSCYQGLLDFAETMEDEGKGDAWTKNIRKAAVMTGEDIVREEVNLAGGCSSSEAWFHGASKQYLPYMRLQETCVTTTWMRFCEKLLETTGDAKWADQIERTFYNAYLGALKPDGTEFSAYTPLSGNRWHGMHHCFMHTDCCTANGPRGFLCFLRQFFRVDKNDAAVFNFYSSALVKGRRADGKSVAFDMYSLYPRTDYVRIVSHTEGVGAIPLKLRIPAWSTKTVVKLNGTEQAGVIAGGYFTLVHDWKLGDIVEITFDMPVVSHVQDRHVAFTRGPVLLARDSRFGDGDLMEPFPHYPPMKSGVRMDGFTAVRTPSDDMWMTFAANLPIGYHSANPEARNGVIVYFCDYASAGNLWRRDNYYRTWFPEELLPHVR